MSIMRKSPHTQSGAALVVGLILLVAITLMAVGSMNTASLDLIMAGNEQYKSRAFHVAEQGIEVAWNNPTDYGTTADYPSSGAWTTAVATGTGNDTYKYRVKRAKASGLNQSKIYPPPPGSSVGTFGAVHWEIEATGTSERGAQAITRQQFLKTVKTDNEITYDANVCLGTDDLDSSCPAT